MRGMEKEFLNCTASTSDDCKFDSIKFQFDNSEFDLSDSETSINSGSLDEESCAVKDGGEEVEKFSQAFNYFDNSSASKEVNETKICLREVLEKSPESNSYTNLPSSDLLLKKTTKIMDFNAAEFDPARLSDDAESKCSAEILTATNGKKSSLIRIEGFTARGDEDKMVVVDDINVLPVRGIQFHEKGRKSAFSKPDERSDQSDMETDDSASDKNRSGQKPHFYNARTVNFFLKKRGKTSQRSKFTQKRAKLSDREKIMTAETRVLHSEVPTEKDIEIKRYLLDFYYYIIFLIFITTIALCMVSSNMYYFTEVTVALFFDTPSSSASNKSESVLHALNLHSNESSILFGKTLKDSHTFEDFWAFAESTMVDLFYWSFYYSKMDYSSHTEKDDRKMMYENEILGVPRMRQVRVRDDSCVIHPNMQRFFRHCYNYYSVFSEETRPIKGGMENTSTATAWVYTKAEDLQTVYYWGEISIYGGGGYYLDFDVRKEKTLEMIKELKKNHWVSRATRAIFIDFNLYNSNVNLFLICKIVLEFPPVGGMLPRKDFHALKLIRYLTVLDFFILACELVLVFFTVYFTYRIVVAWRKQKYSFFAYWWNYIDLSILLLLYAYIILGIVRYVHTERLTSKLQNNYYKYTEFATVKDLQITYNNLIAILVFLCWVKLFMYFNFNLRMVEFRRTLSRSLRDIFGFFPMFLTMFVAFAVLAYLLFGNQVKDYDSVWSSFLALLQSFLGEFEYAQIQESNQIMGPLFYMTFIFFIFFVLLNVFIAIINDAYASVKSEVIGDTPKTGHYIKRGVLNFFDWCDCRKNKKFKKKSSVIRKLYYQDIKKTLANAGFSENEIKVFFAKYNINIDNIADEKTRQKVIEDLELEKINFSENAEEFELSNLRRQIDQYVEARLLNPSSSTSLKPGLAPSLSSTKIHLTLKAKIEELEINMQPTIDKLDLLFNRR